VITTKLIEVWTLAPMLEFPANEVINCLSYETIGDPHTHIVKILIRRLAVRNTSYIPICAVAQVIPGLQSVLDMTPSVVTTSNIPTNLTSV
jgi:hypothetical protein